MSKTHMTMDRFRTLIAAYGARPQAWPGGERAAMQAFLAKNPGTRRHLEAEQRLDTALSAAPEPGAGDDALRARIEAAFVREKQAGTAPAGAAQPGGLLDILRLILPGRGLAPQLTGLAAAALFGILLGLQGAGAPQQYEMVDASAYLAGNPALAEDLEMINR